MSAQPKAKAEPRRDMEAMPAATSHQVLVMPPAQQQKKQLELFDLGIKVQMMLQDFFALVYWSTILDLFFFLFCLCSFMVSPKHAGAVFMHILHLGRMAIGGLIVMKFPKTSVILDNIRAVYKNNEQEPLKNEKLPDFLLSASAHMFNTFKDARVTLFVMIYFILTCVCFLFDLIVFFIALGNFKPEVGEESYAGVLLLTVSAVWMSIDLFYILFAASFLFKVTDEEGINRMLMETFMGFTGKLSAKLDPEGKIIQQAPPKAAAKPDAQKSAATAKRDNSAPQGAAPAKK